MDQSQDKNSGLFQGPTDWDRQSKRLLKEQFGQLTLADLRFETGKEIELLNRIGARLLKTHEEVRNILKKLKLAH